jgi:hypothetical protein
LAFAICFLHNPLRLFGISGMIIKTPRKNHSYKRRNGMGQFLFIILCVTLGYVAYKHAGAVRSDGSALCRKNCDECTRKCWIMKKTEEQK